MKKYILLIATIFTIISAQAQSIQVRAATIEVTADTIVVPIFIDSFNNAASLSLTLDFDNSALGYISFENSTTFSSGLIANVVNGKLFIAWFALNPVNVVTDTLVRLKFVRGQGCFSDLTWDLSNPGANQITDINGTNLSANFTDGLVSFLIEDSPDLVAPVDSSLDVFVYPTLEWTSAECQVDYQLQIATDTLFTNPVVDIGLQDTTYIPSTLSPNTIYHWRVAKRDTRDSLFWSPFWTFGTGGLAAIQPNLPILTDFTDTLTVPVVVDSMFNVTDFNLVMNFDSNEVDLINIQNTSNISGVNITSLANGTLQFDFNTNMGINAVSDTLAMLTFLQKGCSTSLNWDTTGNISSFSYLGIFDLPASFTDGGLTYLDSSKTPLVAPTNFASQVFFQPNLTWQPVECSQPYRLQVALDSNFTNIYLDTLTTDTAVQLFNLQDLTTYYWRIIRTDNVNNAYTTDFWRFTTEQTIVIETKALSASTYLDTLLIPITIDSLQDAAAFELYLDYDPSVLTYVSYEDTTTLIAGLNVSAANGQISIIWTSEDSTASTSGAIPSDTLLQLRFAKSSGCFSDLTWNATTKFTHIVPSINLFLNGQDGLASFLVLDQPTAISPNDTTTSIYPNLQWTTATCAVEYQVQVATDSQFLAIVVDDLLINTTHIPTTLSANTQYFWRALKVDTDGNTFSSDTLMFTTGDAYSSHFEIGTVNSEASQISVPIMVDSLFLIDGLTLSVDYDGSAVSYVGFNNPLLPNINVTDNGGSLQINWITNTVADIVSDTLLELTFDNMNACASDVTWNSSISGVSYIVNGINVPLTFTDGSLNFIDTNKTNLLLPPDISSGTSQTPTLVWGTEDCTEEYILEVATDTFFTNVIVSQTTTDTTYTFTNSLAPSTTYYWRVARRDNLNNLYWSDIWRFNIVVVSTHDVAAYEVPAKVFPNPFRDYLMLEVQTEAKDEFIDLTFYNINGQAIKTQRFNQTGKLLLQVNTSDWSNGMYLLKIQTKNRVRTVKLVK